jgi:hypothetical protein
MCKITKKGRLKESDVLLTGPQRLQPMSIATSLRLVVLLTR